MPTVLIDANMLAQLIQISLQLVQQVEAIRAQAPQVWTQISQDYANAVQAWEAAAKNVPSVIQETLPLESVQTEPTVAEALTGLAPTPAPATTHYNDARLSGVNGSSGVATS